MTSPPSPPAERAVHEVCDAPASQIHPSVIKTGAPLALDQSFAKFFPRFGRVGASRKFRRDLGAFVEFRSCAEAWKIFEFHICLRPSIRDGPNASLRCCRGPRLLQPPLMWIALTAAAIPHIHPHGSLFPLRPLARPARLCQPRCRWPSSAPMATAHHTEVNMRCCPLSCSAPAGGRKRTPAAGQSLG